MSVHVAHNALVLNAQPDKQSNKQPSNRSNKLGHKRANAALKNKYVFTTELDVPPVDNAPHWHSFDAEFYILSGELTLTDCASGQQFVCSSGDRITVPARSIHSELSTSGYRILLGTSVPPDQFGDPVERPAATLTT
jgi:mannose-6-phosphate isomerase-like protein (cupin superfamily)